MKKIIPFIAILSLTSCTQFVLPSSIDDVQTETTNATYESQTEDIEVIDKINYKNQHGIWVPYLEYENIMFGKSKAEFREFIQKKFSSFVYEGINTVYFHVRPSGDAYYKSEIFPTGSFLDGDYDPLEIMLDEAHKLNLSFHAWINPLRLQSTDDMEQIRNNFITKQWVEAEDKTFVKKVNERWYLDPSYEETRNLICHGVKEILENYDVDGIHIDDYFYPTTDEVFDLEEFQQSGAEKLELWRIDNINKMVKEIYDTVQKYGNGAVFGISPQGNIFADYTTQYADVRLWGGNEGYCDYIVPQIYFGFMNETCPFEQTLNEWENLVSDSGVSLIIGLGEYKLGKADMWAGSSGESEWIDNPDIIDRQIEFVNKSSADGYAVYR